MIKKVFTILFLLVSVMLSFSQEYKFSNPYGLVFEPYGRMYFKNNIFYLIDEDKKIFDTFYLNDIQFDDNGYGHVEIFNKDFVIILGGGNVVILSSNDTKLSNVLNPMPENVLTYDDPNYYSDDHRKYTFHPGGIVSITATSSYSEKVGGKSIIYSPDNTRELFYNDFTNYYINSNPIPWVEGVDGPGIGEKVVISFNYTVNKETSNVIQESSDNLCILNGYVNLNHLDWYKKNNRLKRIRVKSLDVNNAFEFEYGFEDVVRLHEIQFPEFVSSVEITILEVYKGSHFDDTCVTGFFTRSINSFSQKILSDRLRKFKRFYP